MANVGKRVAGRDATAGITIGLSDPGMTPMLRCGLGGLAAALLGISESRKKRKWPAPVELGPGHAVVEPRCVRIDFGGSAEKTLQELFKAAFRLRHGLIELVGTYRCSSPPRDDVFAKRQDAIKRTFLQHGQTTEKKGAPKLMSFEVDGTTVDFTVQPFSSYCTQGGYASVLKALRTGSERLAGWAYPGAVQRHVKYGETRCDYGPGETLAAMFTITGAISMEVAGSGGGALIIVEPSDLVCFARTRMDLPPRTAGECVVTGVGDALLAVNVALAAERIEQRKGVASTRGVVLKQTAWNSKQKVRVGLIEPPGEFDSRVLEVYRRVERDLPHRVIQRKSIKKGEPRSFMKPSFLRAFVTENLANGRPWYLGFSTAKTDEKTPRFLHYFADGSNLGALRFEERKGLQTMVELLDASERALVQSVHEALRSRFGMIAEECKGLPAATRNRRFQSERDRWRHALAGAKTLAHARNALADLWSSAGTNRVLQTSWEKVLPLLKESHWQAARDLALVALASYQGRGATAEDSVTDEDQTGEEG